ncbi:unnamed protein product [Prorocentrum cordatum]|uniref:Uncharacterized protein n=1 Tax=Prorocentrum cordatum TaxID=2364126 RepID=A0ABN9XJZ7_9DINO|nr:unnamed protein product [Polarella glacialis]
MLSPYDMLQEPTGDSSSPKLVPSSFPTATQAEWQRDPTSVAGYFARIKEVEVAACVEMQRLKEQGSVERCRITEEHRSRRYDRWADTAKATASEDASTHREAIAANREVAQHAISTSAWVEESQARSRSSLLPGPVAWPWSALAANVVLWGGMRRLGLRSWRGAVVWLVLWALALRKARQALGSKWGSLTWSPSQALVAVLRPALRALGGSTAPAPVAEGAREEKQKAPKSEEESTLRETDNDINMIPIRPPFG